MMQEVGNDLQTNGLACPEFRLLARLSRSALLCRCAITMNRSVNIYDEDILTAHACLRERCRTRFLRNYGQAVLRARGDFQIVRPSIFVERIWSSRSRQARCLVNAIASA